MYFFECSRKSYLQGGLLVPEIQSVLEALVVPGMQNKPENIVKEPVTLYYEIPPLREQQMSTKIRKDSYFYPQKTAPKGEMQLHGAIP